MTSATTADAENYTTSHRRRGSAVTPPDDDGATSHSEGLSSGSGYHGFSSVQKKFTSVWLQRRKITGPAEVEQTRLGLTLLYSPPEPLIDFIFVHGLRGGSIKSWRKYEDASFFWPQAWIPLDRDLHNVRTSTFGYPSDWSVMKDSILNLHDFGRKLLGDLTTCPYLRRNSDTSIVLIGHSMGGLVMKKAYLLARQESHEIADRIRYMFFLATPHRGSDSVHLLKTLLGITTLDRPYLSELQMRSPSLQLINDEFKNVADEVGLWSFYETVKTSLGVKSEIIVDKSSAVLGYKHEKSQFLNADHRGVCKFESPEDPDFVSVRNALVAVVDDLLMDVVQNKEDDKSRQIQLIQSYLNVTETPESDLEEQLELQTPETCKWIEDRKGFRHWREVGIHSSNIRWNSTIPGWKQDINLSDRSGPCYIYWLSANPGSGKSVSAAHVTRHLKELGHDCSYFFFKFGVRAKQVLSSLYRSLAFQMALLHPSIRQTLTTMESTGNNYDKDDEGTIWRKLFANNILKTKLDRPQFWVIDALDECLLSEKLFPSLAKLECAFELRIFVTSRPTPELQRSFGRLKLPVVADQIRPVDTKADLRLYLRSDEENLPVAEEKDRAALVNQLLKKSGGSFLWVRLVRRELENVYSEDSIASVLEEIPAEMSELYRRSLETMSKNVRERKLIQALLTWAAVSVRPLTLSELQTALRVDAGLQVRELRRSIQGLCGNLLYVDSLERVQLVHPTARDFLLDETLESEFAVHRGSGHERLARACLRFMEEEMRPPRTRSLGSNAAMKKSERPVFADYASMGFSEHISGSSSTSDALLVALSKFLMTNILAWIEYIAAEKRTLYPLIRTAKNLRKYLERRAKHVSPLGCEFQTVENWSTDLIRLVAKFGRNLLQYPGSIFFLIPAVAPHESRLHQQSLNSLRWLEVVGLAGSSWDDCASQVQYKGSWATALASGETVFAIGMKNGMITVYDQSTCQMKSSMTHTDTANPGSTSSGANARRPSPVKQLAFDTLDQRLASATPQSVCVWTSDGELLYVFATQDPCVTLAFAVKSDQLIAISRASRVFRYDLNSKEQHLRPPSPLARRLSHGSISPNAKAFPRQAPLAATISPDQTILALLYRGRPIYLWSLQDDTLLGLCGRDVATKSTNISVQTALFNPNSDSGLLAVAYQDGELALYDTWLQKELTSVEGNAYTLAAAPDGRTLATGDTRGSIQIWDFETLTLLYCIRSGLDDVRRLAFSGDGCRLIDIRDSKTKIWEPSALIRRTAEEDASVSEAQTLQVSTFGVNEEPVEVTAMAPSVDGHFVFAGRSDGSVVAYGTAAGRLISTLYTHDSDLFVTAINYSSGTLVSADAGGRVLACTITVDWQQKPTSSLLLDRNISEPIQQLLLNSSGDRVITVTASTDHMLILSGTPSILERRRRQSNTSSWRRWTSIDEDTVALLDGQYLRLFEWRTFNELDSYFLQKDLTSSTPNQLAVPQDIMLDASKKHVIASFNRTTGDTSGSEVYVWVNPFRKSDSETSLVQLAPVLKLTSNQIKAFLGVEGCRAVFLDHELWICSIDLSEVQRSSINDIRRHFFISPDFVGNLHAPIPIVTPTTYVVFAKESQLAIIKGGLDWSYE